MFRRTVTSPDGRRWTLGRRWLPGRLRIKKAEMPDGMPDWFEVGDDFGFFAMVLTALTIGVLGIFLVLLLFNVVALAIELTIVIVIALATLIGRVLFRRPWIVFARSGNERREYPVVGYRASRRKLSALAAELEAAPGDRR